MHIERVQVEEGFLDGLDVEFTPGLNVIIGARGTGKTSLIELIRFCLGAPGHTTETEQRSWNHALSVLGSGQVTVILSDGGRKVNVTRTIDDTSPRASAPFSVPIIFSQTEIEAVGLEAAGRLRILDSFLEDDQRMASEEAAAASDVRSHTAEAGTLRRDIDEFERQLSELPSIIKRLSELTSAEQRLSKVSTEAAEKKQKLDTISASISTGSVATAAIGRFKQSVSSWYGAIKNTVRVAPQVDPWPSEGGNDLLTFAYERIDQARQYLCAALDELEQAAAEVKAVEAATETQKIALEEQARQLRREIDNLQSGAGSVTRQGQQLRAQKAQLESLKNVRNERNRQLEKVLKQRDADLDRLEIIRENRFHGRKGVAERLSKILGDPSNPS